MDRASVQQKILHELHLRVSDEMADYVVRQIRSAMAGGLVDEPIRIIGGEARTGVAVQCELPNTFVSSVRQALKPE
ncbi:MAG: hypothetical protein IT448_00770 [Phycisphaerales bacterium]|nr:hypothetical protein [Phycisphaerales bacterium]